MPGRRRGERAARPSDRAAAVADVGPSPAPHRERAPPPVHTRFIGLDEYRAEREWRRLEGTPVRELFRELRRRFLERHAGGTGWAVDLGAGPGRFSPWVGGPGARRVLVDLSRSMLVEATRRWDSAAGPLPDRLLADAIRPPLGPGRFAVVAMLGNVVGFAGSRANAVLEAGIALAAPGATVVVEVAPGPGERSRYLGRLPPGAVRRLLRAPLNAIRPRVEREGFRSVPPSPDHAGFARLSGADVRAVFDRHGIELLDSLAIAPALGADADRVSAARGDPLAWHRLLELEEAIGRSAARHGRAAALLLAGRTSPRPGPAEGAGNSS
ncbi:MAG TPA: class I SAM-dependent methyltransferase [Thermoplasmata archaeon]|nr:class I SAM-dependent methyltransferase [Thermoplasmata archaeon]